MSAKSPYHKRAISRIKEVKGELLPASKLLRKWLIENEMTVPQLAIRTGFAAGTLYAYVNSQPNMYPSLAQAFAIEYVTNGTIPAWMWLDNPYIKARVRAGNMAGAKRFEENVKSFALKYGVLRTVDGVLRHKARIFSRMFGVEWGEVKKRCWTDARAKARKERADVTMYLEATDG